MKVGVRHWRRISEEVACRVGSGKTTTEEEARARDREDAREPATHKEDAEPLG